jgi:hypothetical protein
MTRDGPARECRDCRFCREIGESLHCVRNAPTPDPITGQARWPTVRADDYCGRFRDTAPDPRSEIDGPSCRNAATAPNHQSSIILHQSPALPVLHDSFGPFCKIPLTHDRFAKVDPEDYLWLAQFRWCCKLGRDTCYAVRHIQVRGRTKRIHMHRQIMDTPKGLVCDHINHDGLDNRRRNCRNCTREQNNANRRKRATGHGSRAPSSQYLGVSYCRKRQKWVAYIKRHGRSKFLGQYDEPEPAARAHDAAAWALWGEYACLNFPEEWPGHPAAKRLGGQRAEDGGQ